MSDVTEIDVSFTAKVMAAGRAIETQRSDALFLDPFAEQLAGAEAFQATTPRLEEYEKQGRPFSAGLENEAYGRDYLCELDVKLLDKVQR